MPNFRAPSLAVIVPGHRQPADLGALPRRRSSASSEPPGRADRGQPIPRARGPAAARNAGVAGPAASCVAFVDADVVVDPEALARLRARVRRRPGPRRGLRRLRRRAGGAGHGLAVSQPSAPPRPRRCSPGPAETFWAGPRRGPARASTPPAASTRSATPRPSIEDIELGMRLRALGRRDRARPGVRGTHLKRWSLRSMVRTDLRRRGVPWMRLQLERRRDSRARSTSAGATG